MGTACNGARLASALFRSQISPNAYIVVACHGRPRRSNSPAQALLSKSHMPCRQPHEPLHSEPHCASARAALESCGGRQTASPGYSTAVAQQLRLDEPTVVNGGTNPHLLGAAVARAVGDARGVLPARAAAPRRVPRNVAAGRAPLAHVRRRAVAQRAARRVGQAEQEEPRIAPSHGRRCHSEILRGPSLYFVWIIMNGIYQGASKTMTVPPVASRTAPPGPQPRACGTGSGSRPTTRRSTRSAPPHPPTQTGSAPRCCTPTAARTCRHRRRGGQGPWRSGSSRGSPRRRCSWHRPPTCRMGNPKVIWDVWVGAGRLYEIVWGARRFHWVLWGVLYDCMVV
jgi:hypothetical protein